MFENRVFRKIFGPKSDEVIGKWSRLRNEELYNVYCSPNINASEQIKKNEMGGACSSYTERRCVHRILAGKPEGRIHFENLVVDERMILRGIFEKWDGGLDWISLAQDRRVAGCCKCGKKTFGFHKIQAIS
jgi:hypothetical protein